MLDLVPPTLRDDRCDYQRFLAEYGLDANLVGSVVENPSDQMAMPQSYAGWVRVQESILHGQGLFAMRSFQPNDLIAPARVDRKRTPAGRYTNHALRPNARMVRLGEAPDADMSLFATEVIAAGAEVTIDYRQAAAVNGNRMAQIPDEVSETARLRQQLQPVQRFAWNIDPALPPREQIAKLIAGMLAAPACHVHFPVTHHFAKGMYIRTMFIAKGRLIAGKVHRQECINICAAGDISILTETGSMRVTAPFQIVSPAGMQRIGYAHEDTTWINIFLTDETDIATLERDLVFTDAEAIALIDPDYQYFTPLEAVCQ